MITEKKYKKIMKKYKKIFETIENYDLTRELPFQKKRIDITLQVKTINALKKLSKETNKPISHLIEEKLSDI